MHRACGVGTSGAGFRGRWAASSTETLAVCEHVSRHVHRRTNARTNTHIHLYGRARPRLAAHPHLHVELVDGCGIVAKHAVAHEDAVDEIDVNVQLCADKCADARLVVCVGMYL